MNLPFPAPNMLQCRLQGFHTSKPKLDEVGIMPKWPQVLSHFQLRAGRDRYRRLAVSPRDVGSGLSYPDC